MGLPNLRQFACALLLSSNFFSLGAYAAEARLSGTATYRERIALPPGAIFEAVLEDVSRAGAPAERIGSSRLEPAGQPPFRFTIRYDSERIHPAHRYAVRAQVTLNGTLLFTTDTLNTVLTHGKPDTAELLLKQPSRRKPAPQADASLVNTYWKLLRLNGETISVREGGREPYFVLNNKAEPGVSGFAGCNRFMGSYTLKDKDLKFGHLATTMMACANDSAPEYALFSVFSKFSHWRISGQSLHLLDAEGQSLAEFEARHMH